jgi:GTP-binding protein Era
VLIGWTNTGKSTLLNRLVGMHLAIATPRSQTTRHRIMGIVQGENYQLALIDTPGLHHAKKELSKYMIRTSWEVAKGSDVIIWVVVPDKSPKAQYKSIEKRIDRLKQPLIVAINKIDNFNEIEIKLLIEELKNYVNSQAFIPISALRGDNIDFLLKTIISNLPISPPLFSEDEITDQPEKLIAAEIIREQIIRYTYQEIPHSVAVEVESFKEDTEKQLIRMICTIYVERKSQKGIVIGKDGIMLKKIGIQQLIRV